MITFAQALTAGQINTTEAVSLFDNLPPAEIDFMLGNWKGGEFPTGHRLDGMLEAYHWHGKRFDSADEVHPLVFTARNGKQVTVNPVAVMPGVPFAGRVPLLKSWVVGTIFQALVPRLRTRRPRATLKLREFRGKTSAAMVYNDLPITDHFRKVDENTALGCMEMKGLRRPYFFVLRRE